MIEITRLSKSTIRRSLEALEDDHKLIQKVGKPFGGSCRYRLTAIVPSEGQKAAPIVPPANRNSSTRAPIEAAPIVPPANRNSSTRGTPIVPPEGQEGNPIKVIQLRVSNKEEIELPFSSDEFREAWCEWEQHKREIKKPLTPTSIRKQLEDLAKMSEAESIAAMHRSIANGWQGISAASSKTKPDHRQVKAAREYAEPSTPLPML